jgi:hypothetical protein
MTLVVPIDPKVGLDDVSISQGMSNAWWISSICTISFFVNLQIVVYANSFWSAIKVPKGNKTQEWTWATWLPTDPKSDGAQHFRLDVSLLPLVHVCMGVPPRCPLKLRTRSSRAPSIQRGVRHGWRSESYDFHHHWPHLALCTRFENRFDNGVGNANRPMYTRKRSQIVHS